MNEESMRGLLCELLGCGYLDLRVIENCKYDMSDVLDRAREAGEQVTLNSLAWGMFELGMDDIANFISERVQELEGASDLSDEEAQELEALQALDVRDDIETFHNFIDTHAWLRNHADVYAAYCQPALDLFEEYTGYALES